MLRVVSIHDNRFLHQNSKFLCRRLLSSVKQPAGTADMMPKHHPGIGKFVKRSEYAKIMKSSEPTGRQHFLRAGLPFLLFSVGAFWVVQNAIDGKLKERAISRREVSQSERQAFMEEEHDDIMEKMTKAVKKDFDNTKRIERPEDILARRKAERDLRNVWYRRWWRSVKGDD